MVLCLSCSVPPQPSAWDSGTSCGLCGVPLRLQHPLLRVFHSSLACSLHVVPREGLSPAPVSPAVGGSRACSCLPCAAGAGRVLLVPEAGAGLEARSRGGFLVHDPHPSAQGFALCSPSGTALLGLFTADIPAPTRGLLNSGRRTKAQQLGADANAPILRRCGEGSGSSRCSVVQELTP